MSKGLPTPELKLQACKYVANSVAIAEGELESTFNSLSVRKHLPHVAVKEFGKLLMDIYEFKIKLLGRAVIYEDIVYNEKNKV